MSSSASPAKPKRTYQKGDNILRAIGVYKMVKTTLLCLVVLAVVHVIRNGTLTDQINRLATYFNISPDNHWLLELLRTSEKVTQTGLQWAAVLALVYAILFFIEGIGLLMLQHWAEWMTVITTGTLIPLEILEIHRQYELWKVAGMLLNVVIFAYLTFHVWREHKQRLAHRAEQSASTPTQS